MVSVQIPRQAPLGLSPQVSYKQQSTFDQTCSTDSSSSKQEEDVSQCYVTTPQFPNLSDVVALCKTILKSQFLLHEHHIIEERVLMLRAAVVY